jgi:hypothetical protein
VHGLALDALGRDDASDVLARADAEFEVLADRITDPELRGWFERQALAPTA